MVGFQHESEANRFHHDLDLRLRPFHLELHPEKTRLIRFGKFAAPQQRERGLGKPPTFDFLGFTHICGKSREGRFVLFRHSAKKRMRAKLGSLRSQLHARRHLPVAEQGGWLASVVRGYFAYHAVPTNAKPLESFRTEIIHHWRRALRRRGQRDRTNWTRMARLAERWIPKVRITHSWPQARFDVRTRGRSRVR